MLPEEKNLTLLTIINFHLIQKLLDPAVTRLFSPKWTFLNRSERESEREHLTATRKIQVFLSKIFFQAYFALYH